MAQRSDQNFKLVASAVRFIEDNIALPLTVDTVCALSRKSKWQTQRIFRALVGDSLAGYIRGRKLSGAFQALRQTTLPVAEISRQFAFGSQETFARAFKEQFGLTAREARLRPESNSRFLKPALTEAKLEMIAYGISREPVLQTFPAKTLVGLSVEIASPFSDKSKFNDSLLAHWHRFRQIRAPKKFNYGLVAGESNGIDSPQLNYVAANELEPGEEIPPELKKIEIQSQLYAIFEVRGPVNLCHVMTDYVYGIWLPQSSYKRATGYEIDLYDSQVFSLGSKRSVSYRYVPIKPK